MAAGADEPAGLKSALHLSNPCKILDWRHRCGTTRKASRKGMPLRSAAIMDWRGLSQGIRGRKYARAIALALPLMSTAVHRVRPRHYGRRAAGFENPCAPPME
jgi:hypothetical protein